MSPVRFTAIALALPLVLVACDDEGSPAAVGPASPTPPAATPVVTPAKSEQPAPPASAPAAPSAAGTARLVLDRAMHDFGRMEEFEVRSTSVGFRNAGDAPLRIVEVKSSCGCTVPKLAKKEYAPGEAGELEITFDPSGPGERTRKYVTIISNSGGETSVLEFPIVADVNPFMLVEPRIVKADIRLGQPWRGQIDVGFPDPSFEIETVEATNPFAKVSVLPERLPALPESKIETENGATVAVDVSPEAPWGSFFSWVTIRGKGLVMNGDTQELYRHEMKVRVQGTVFGELVAEPDTFRFGEEKSTPFERAIVLRNRDGRPWAILGTELSFPGMESSRVEIEPIDASAYRVVLKASGAPVERQYQGNLVVRTNIPGEEQIDLRIVGVIRPRPIGIGK